MLITNTAELSKRSSKFIGAEAALQEFPRSDGAQLHFCRFGRRRSNNAVTVLRIRSASTSLDWVGDQQHLAIRVQNIIQWKILAKLPRRNLEFELDRIRAFGYIVHFIAYGSRLTRPLYGVRDQNSCESLRRTVNELFKMGTSQLFYVREQRLSGYEAPGTSTRMLYSYRIKNLEYSI